MPGRQAQTRSPAQEPMDQSYLGRVVVGQKLEKSHVRREIHKSDMLKNDDVIRVRVPVGYRPLEPSPMSLIRVSVVPSPAGPTNLGVIRYPWSPVLSPALPRLSKMRSIVK